MKKGSYAPLLENVNDRDRPVNKIHFDSSRSDVTASYHANNQFAEQQPTVNHATAVDHRSGSAKPITARVGLGTHDTAAEFKDVVIERDGREIFRSDFATPTGWTPERCSRWSGSSGAGTSGSCTRTARGPACTRAWRRG